MTLKHPTIQPTETPNNTQYKKELFTPVSPLEPPPPPPPHTHANRKKKSRSANTPQTWNGYQRGSL